MPYIKCTMPEQQNALEELKNRIKDELTSPALLEDDALFYKFLKSRNFNVDKAEKILRKHLIWRKVYGVDNILENFTPKEVFVKYVEPSVIGRDKDGDIVTYVSAVNNPELVKCIKINDYVKHMIWFVEKHTALNNRQNRKTGVKAPVTLIMDLETLDFSNATSKANGWKEKLLQVIDADVLPAFLGGKRTDPDGDPRCKSFITSEREIPKKYYLSYAERFFENETDIVRVTIPASEKKEIPVFVKEAGSLIRWRFMVVNKTIAFGLFFQESDKEMKELLPLYEYDTSDGTEEDSFVSVSEGKYVIVFDNSYSKFSSKEVQYVIYVEKPKM